MSISQLDKAIPLLLGMNDKMGQMDDKLGLMSDKMGLMLEKQTETVEELRDLRLDLIKRSDNRLARIEKDIRAIKSRIGLR